MEDAERVSTAPWWLAVGGGIAGHVRFVHQEMRLGDITELVHLDEIDVLVVSAFPDDYRPTPSSVIGALHRKGLDVPG